MSTNVNDFQAGDPCGADFPLAASPKAMNPERRQSLRQSLHSLVYLDLEGSNGGIVLDLGEGGMQISLAHPLGGVEDIRFSLRLQPRHRIRGTGRIAWISDSGRNAGVCFVSLSQEALGQIRACLGVRAEVAEPTSDEREQHERKRSVEVNSKAQEAEPVSAPVAPPSEIVAEPGPSILSLYEQNGPGNGLSAMQEPTAARTAGDTLLTPTEQHDGARARVPAPQAETAAVVAGGGGEQERDTGVLFDEAESSVLPQREEPSPPPPWLEALIEAGRRQRWEGVFPEAEGPREESEAEPPEPKPTEPAAAAESDAQPDATPLAVDCASALYLPNYRIEADHKTGDVRLRKFDLHDKYQMGMNLAFERLEEFGWTLERDWHIWVALVLVLAGFLALAQKPPLVLVTGTLWLSSAFVAVKRKQRSRAGGTSGPSVIAGEEPEDVVVGHDQDQQQQENHTEL